MRCNALKIARNSAVLFGMSAVLLLWSIPFLVYGENSDEADTETTETDTLTPAEEALGETPSQEEPVADDMMDDVEILEDNDGNAVLTKFSVTPIVANEKAKPRDIIKKELLVTNNTSRRIDLYISVENVDPTDGTQEFVSPGVSDLSTSLANWIEITRGVIELAPGESRKIPYLIHINLTAKPGTYYARIQFQEGSRRTDVVESEDGTALLLNLEVLDDAEERLQLGNFISDDSVVLGSKVSFSYFLENVGNRLIEPRGSIRIFNRRGEEVGSIPLNAEGKEINPDNTKQLAAAWSAAGRFGKYKAFLDLEYGENQLASVQDTVYFWVFPWKEILAALIGVVVLAIAGTFVIHMRTMARPALVPRAVQAESQEMQTPRAQSFPDLHQTETPRHIRPQPMQGGGQQATVLARAPRHNEPTQVSPQTKRAPMVQQGGTIELTSRGNQQHASKHGDTIQLSRRR